MCVSIFFNNISLYKYGTIHESIWIGKSIVNNQMKCENITIEPLAIALRGEQGSIALFECSLDNCEEEKLHLWATCGERKRFPVPTEARFAERKDGVLRFQAAVKMPAQYTACTLHVWVVDGLKTKTKSCRISDANFRKLAPAAHNAENDNQYHEWFLAHRLNDVELEKCRNEAKKLEKQPLISIVTPVYRTPKLYLKAMIDSVLAQTYTRFELIIVNVSGECPDVDAVLGGYDDKRLRVLLAPNKTIPENTNVGIESARGDYVAFIDHDDFIEPDALFRYVEMLNKYPETDLLFCDEDLWIESNGDGRFAGARFKPGWNPDLLFTHNYVCHMLMVSKWALGRVELSDPLVNGAQDYDLTLKVSEIARGIRHVPRMLYHWRVHPASTAANRESKPYALEAGRLAVQGHFNRRGPHAEVSYGTAPFSYRVEYDTVNPNEITIVVYNRRMRMLPERFGYAYSLGGKIEIVVCSLDCINEAIDMAQGSVVVLLDESVEVSGELWLKELARQLVQPQIGCCAPLLLDKRGIVQSAGMSMSREGYCWHSHKGYPEEDVGYMTMLEHVHDVSAVSIKCLALSKGVFESVGGFDESLVDEAMAFDYCAKIYDAGFLTAMVPSVSVVASNDSCLEGANRIVVSDLSADRALCEDDPYRDTFFNYDFGGYGIPT